MSESASGSLESRLLVLAPVGKDAALTSEKLGAAGLQCDVCANVSSLVAEIAKGAAGVLVAEEALAAGTDLLSAALSKQPAWSDLPVIVITRPGADSGTVGLALRTLGNVILLERPIRVSSLISAARTALRARSRQYESRAQLVSLEETDRRKDEFLATLAHELRNPLAPIRNSVELLRLAGDSLPMARKLADMMGRQVSHMVRLVDDLLEISRITRGAIELRRSPVMLADVVASAIETSQPAIDAARHRLEVILPQEPIWLDADPTRLAQVFSNLLNNAAKYTDDEGFIRLQAEQTGDEVVVRVHDSGIGITPDLLPRVFEMFAQGESAPTRAPGGLGIGLTLVRSLVEMHGGTVVAESAGTGCGSVMTVKLPLAGASGAHGTLDVGQNRVKIEAVPRILVVDDNRDAADSLGALLEILGGQIAVAHDGQDALKLVESHRPDIVFLDIGMPEMDGYEVARRIRRLSHDKPPYLVALTGWGQEKDRQRSEAAGFDQHLVKPANIEALETLLGSIAAGTAR